MAELYPHSSIRLHGLGKSKVVRVLNEALFHKDISGSGCIQLYHS
jgi:hypothetical protein